MKKIAAQEAETQKHLTPKELRLLQLTELELLLEFDRICRTYGIKYTMIGGTLLGAVRHKGFIPWDDDADVAMLRTEYEKFKEACKAELNGTKYYFQDQFVTEGYRWGYAKLRRKGTAFVRPNTEEFPYEQGIYIDIMPLDYLPEHRAGQLLCNIVAFLLRKTGWSEVGKKQEKNLFYRGLYHLLSCIPMETYNKAYKKFIDWTNRRPTGYLRCLGLPIVCAKGNTGYWRYRTEWLEDTVEYEFETYRLIGFRQSQLPLSRMYGDYLTPVCFPPISISECVLPKLEEIQVDEKLKEAFILSFS
ncbi:LicD family protein [Candidatus Avoscillospira sp. LCP25S3_F1]|uniref:LicD family protein n=1 Tax=Candidatus Avoscillospira sp. LCP25S3_F1 TaxID=3438825 RepID=UPI003F8ED002